MALHGFAIFAVAESSLPLFYIDRMGARARRNKRIAVEKYMRDTAPEKYHSLLIPDFDVGYKVMILRAIPYLLNIELVANMTNFSQRRIFNDGYLEACTLQTSLSQTR
jgi:hypothetical protein